MPASHSLEFLTTVFWVLCLKLVLSYETEPVGDFIACVCTHGFPDSSVKNPPAVQEPRVQSLLWEDPLEKGQPTHSSILAWRIP